MNYKSFIKKRKQKDRGSIISGGEKKDPLCQCCQRGRTSSKIQAMKLKKRDNIVKVNFTVLSSMPKGEIVGILVVIDVNSAQDTSSKT
jgi:hypothetical protein